MSLSTIVKRLQNIMRNDTGINGDAQRIEQIVWLLFLKIYDTKEADWEFMATDAPYRSVIPERLRWRNWAVDRADGQAMTGDALLQFVNNDLFPTLKNLPLDEHATRRQRIVRAAFEDNNNYMKDGILLRQVINVIDEIDFESYEDRHAFGEIYETILKSLQSAGNAGEFYTPRAVTDFMARMLAPKIGERVADFACGTGGFLVSALKLLEPQIRSTEDRELCNASLYGCEKKALPYLLCATNMFLHDVDSPNVFHSNSLARRVQDRGETFDIILMNPPYGGSELEAIRQNFPVEFRSSETADLFMAVILYRLREGGRAAVILPDGFLFGADGAKRALKEALFARCNLHTVIRLPRSVFAPYTGITTNILFFDRNGPTRETWFYRLDLPEGYKAFSKTKPMRLEHFAPVMDWWNARRPLVENDVPRAACYAAADIAARDYNLDLCGFPHEEEEILPPAELIARYREERQRLAAALDERLDRILAALGE